MTIAENKQLVYQRIKAAQARSRFQQAVEVIAVTKYVGCPEAKALVDLGIEHLGENRVDQFLEKYKELAGKPITWHLIGSLQRRKVKEVINYIDYFHALDSLKLAAEIQKRAQKPIKCFLQVNISEEASKHGFYLSEIEAALEELKAYDKIILVGLMTMTPLAASQDDKRAIFQKAKILQESLAERKLERMPFAQLSMGMSDDFDIAIQEGANFIRVGSAFFK
ncbi:YggS family pyridoxal phosphate-dependent enzyme [Streptococcus cuniculipharyngis]|uniref:Pyridoxal phosphate homeostasis protein n=1 Tax=Streptococcus cuniculipharyngis TaxID=1562651 RepID=A0A5C5S939_9STRE|nr:YggS family pyridoxal phosphate-dependent enzyme [Streptococcus cuniculipharyngis]TWS96926.1 YggS family pyridoxal phosphate-dependent enzyme [Streptococcus cuniculipharyngis]